MKTVMALVLTLAMVILPGCAREEEDPETLPHIVLTEAPTEYEEPTTLPPATEAPTVETTEETEAPTEEEEPPLPSVSVPTEPPVETVPKEEFGVKGVVVGSSAKVNVRKGPSTHHPVVKKVKLDDMLTVYEVGRFEGTNWARVDGGWMALGYIELVDKFPEPSEDTGTPAMVANTEFVNVRKEASAASDRVCQLHRRDVVHVLEVKETDTASWARTEKGWISMKYLEVAEEVVLKNKPAAQAPAE